MKILEQMLNEAITDETIEDNAKIWCLFHDTEISKTLDALIKETKAQASAQENSKQTGEENQDEKIDENAVAGAVGAVARKAGREAAEEAAEKGMKILATAGLKKAGNELSQDAVVNFVKTASKEVTDDIVEKAAQAGFKKGAKESMEEFILRLSRGQTDDIVNATAKRAVQTGREIAQKPITVKPPVAKQAGEKGAEQAARQAGEEGVAKAARPAADVAGTDARKEAVRQALEARQKELEKGLERLTSVESKEAGQVVEQTFAKVADGTPIEDILEGGYKKWHELIKAGKTEKEASELVNKFISEEYAKRVSSAARTVAEAAKKKGIELTEEEIRALFTKYAKEASKDIPKMTKLATAAKRTWKAGCTTIRAMRDITIAGAVGVGAWKTYEFFDNMNSVGDPNTKTGETIDLGNGKKLGPEMTWVEAMKEVSTPEEASIVWDRMPEKFQNGIAVKNPELFKKLPLTTRFMHRLLRGRNAGGWPIENIALTTAAAYGLWKARKYLWSRTMEFTNWARSGDSLAKCTFTADGKDYIADFDMKQKVWKLRYQGTTVTKESSVPSKEEVKDFFQTKMFQKTTKKCYEYTSKYFNDEAFSAIQSVLTAGKLDEQTKKAIVDMMENRKLILKNLKDGKYQTI